MSELPAKRCEKCRFFSTRSGVMPDLMGNDRAYTQYLCHRYPPARPEVTTYPHNWCGEWQPIGDNHAAVFSDWLEEQGEQRAAEKLRQKFCREG